MIKQPTNLFVKPFVWACLRYFIVHAFIWTVILSFLLPNNIFGQQTFRRHFIIAYDISSPFIKAEKNCPSYERALITLFSNKGVSQFNEAYQDNLSVEKKNGLPFFDKQRDEVSFFHFNIAGKEFDDLRWLAYNGDEYECI